MSNKKSQSSQKTSRPKRGQVINPDPPAKTRREELEQKSDKELDELYFTTFGKEPDENLRAEDKIDQIEANLPVPPRVVPASQVEPPTTPTTKPRSAAERKQAKRTTFRTKEGREFTLTGDIEGFVVVRQVQVQELNGGMVEVPNTESVQTYYPEQFEQMRDNNFFSESKLKIEVLQTA